MAQEMPRSSCCPWREYVFDCVGTLNFCALAIVVRFGIGFFPFGFLAEGRDRDVSEPSSLRLARVRGFALENSDFEIF
jgi:hypothetical protein